MMAHPETEFEKLLSDFLIAEKYMGEQKPGSNAFLKAKKAYDTIEAKLEAILQEQVPKIKTEED